MDFLAETGRGGAAAWFADAAADAAAGDSSRERQPAMVERSAHEGQMAPLLRRDEDESYRVVEGELTFYVDGEVIAARRGDVVVAPGGSARTFRVESAHGARWLVLTRVASLQNYTDFGRAVSAPLDPPADWPSEHERFALEALGRVNGITLLGPPGALPR